MRNRFLAFIATFIVAMAGVLAVASPAQADDAGELPNCAWNSTGIGAPYGGGSYTGSGDWYAYGPVFVITSSSQCEDLQITNLFYMTYGMKFRVRFYPSAGGSFVNSWKYVNPNCWTCNFVIATNISNGTWLRIEGVQHWPGDPMQTVVDENFEIRF